MAARYFIDGDKHMTDTGKSSESASVEAGTLDPRERLLAAPMSRFQTIAVFNCVLLAMMDGFDVVAITFAVPAIVNEWGITKADAGVVLSAGLFGMAFGALLLSPLADWFGRRRILLATLSLVLVSTFWTAMSSHLIELIASRFLAGLGLGTLISINYILAAEYANARRRDFAVGMVVTSFGVGAISGGLLSAWLLSAFGWRAIFLFGVGFGVMMLLLAWRTLQEPLALILARPGKNGLARANEYLRRCGHPAIADLQLVTTLPDPISALFKGDLARDTALLTVILFFYMIPQYYLQTWAPTLVTDLGFSPSQAALVSSFFSVGGVTAGAFISATSARIGIKRLNYVLMTGGAIMTVAFSLLPAHIIVLIVGAAITGFFIQGGLVAFYVIVQRTFPAHTRASGTGIVLGIGRLGSTLPPLIAGFMFTEGASRTGVTLLMAAPLILCLLLLWRFRVRPPTVA
jgi:MFS transporter, AAHS family, 4-hydroxybenzoate transporter